MGSLGIALYTGRYIHDCGSCNGILLLYISSKGHIFIYLMMYLEQL